MARGPFSSGNDFTSTSPGFALPFTMAVWFYPTFLSSNATMIEVGDSNAENHSIRQISGLVAARTNEAGTVRSSSVGSFGINAWHHGAAVFAATNSRTAYLNGVAGITNTDNLPVTPYDEFAIGHNLGGTTAPSGYLAEIGIWNVALTATEIASLAKGFAPRLIRPASLVHYLPLVRSNFQPKGVLTANGSVGVFPHPRIIGSLAG